MWCVVKNCNSNNNKSKSCAISFFKFPSDPTLLKQWISFCSNKNINLKTSRICMAHFKPEDFENNLQFEMGFTKRRFLKTGVVPTIRIVSSEDQDQDNGRVQRIQRRENKKIVKMLIEEHDSLNASANQPSVQLMGNEICMERLISSESEVLLENFSKNSYEENEKQFLKKEIERLEKENSSLKETSKSQAAELKSLKVKIEKESKFYDKNLKGLRTQLLNLEEKLLCIFTRRQIEKLKAGVKRSYWNEEDVTQAITLYAASAKLYKLMYRKHFPLPSVRTLQRWREKVHITTGLLEPVFKLLSASTHMTEINKICVLSFDEAKIRKTYCYDRTSDTTLAPVNYVQVVMIRGLVAKWKQPIFYNYDCKMTPEIMDNILSQLKSCDYTVAAIVCDLEGGNRALFNELEVTEEKPWFIFNGEKVFVFADVPHMIKHLRNHFVDEGFLINGKPVCAEIISKLLDITSGDLRISHKISEANLNVANAERQKVKLATNLLSNTVAQAIMRAASQGHLEGLNWEECHRLFKMTNDWFDVMNAMERVHAYGVSLSTQNQILDGMTEMVKGMRAIGRNTLLPFQKGIIQSNNAIKGLYNNMVSRYGLKFILTFRLNQDVLENFFEVIRPKGGLHDHPDQLEFKYRLRSYILGRKEGIFSLTGKIIGVLNGSVKTEEPEPQELTDMEYDGLENLAGYIPEIVVPQNVKQPTNSFDHLTEDGSFKTIEPETQELTDMEYDGLENLAGYIPEIAVPQNVKQPTNSFDHLTEDGLSKPTQKTMEALENIFNTENAQDLVIRSNFIKSLLEQAHHIECDEKVKTLFFRSRMYFKIRKLNEELSDSTTSRKRKCKKIMTTSRKYKKIMT